jgi:endonuclease YncB( thermonuclease family)
MSATPEPAKPMLIEAQADAIKHRRGMWAHGVPQYVLTSLHSINEPGS